MPTYQTAHLDETSNIEGLRQNLDMLDERREVAALREAKYKASTAQYYNARVRNTQFKPGEMVLRKNEASRVEGQKKKKKVFRFERGLQEWE